MSRIIYTERSSSQRHHPICGEDDISRASPKDHGCNRLATRLSIINEQVAVYVCDIDHAGVEPWDEDTNYDLDNAAKIRALRGRPSRRRHQLARRRDERLTKARARRALMRGRRAALRFFSDFGPWAEENGGRWLHPREIVRHVEIWERNAGWKLAAKMGGPLRDFGLMRGFCVAPGYHEGVRGGGR